MTISFRQVKAFPHFLYLLPLFFVLHGYIEYYPAIPPANAFLLFLKYCLATAVVAGLLYLFIRSFRTAAVMAFAVFAFHFFFGPAHDVLMDISPASFFARYTVILPATVIIGALLLYFARKKKPAFPNLSAYLVLLLFVLLLIDVVTLGVRFSKKEPEDNFAASFTACDTCEKPDIYLIIADSYTGKVPLKEVFRFDNSAFENALRSRGFHIVDSSKSNYNYTPFTMASMLGMQYLQGLEGHNRSLNDRKICYGAIDKNPVTGYVDKLGYEFKNFSIFKFAGELPLRTTSFYKTGEDLIKAQTFLARIDRDIRYHTVTYLKLESEIKRLAYDHLELNKILYKATWDEISQPSTTKPRFVYTHIEMPHYPYYYNKDGQPNPLEDLVEDKQSDTANYLGYLQYGNTKYLGLIDHILTHAKKPPVILFMSDHAFREYPGEAVDRRYHFMNFNSIYLPGRPKEGFYNGISTVNQFRVLFNTLFKQNLPMLKDSTSFLLQ